MNKRYSYIGIRKHYWPIILLVFIMGCELYYVPTENEIAKIESLGELESAANGVYALLKNTVNTDEYFELNRNANDLTFGNFSYSTYYKLEFGLDFFRQEKFTDEGEIYTWNSMFKVIASVNNVLSSFSIENETDSEYRKIFGEMLFIRAYAYFRLTRSYGQIPVIQNVDVNFTAELATYDAIYQSIVDDLNLAYQLLPESIEKSRIPYETPHRGMSKAILAEVYLSWAGYPANNTSKYEEAANTAKELIDSAEIYGMGILDDFAQLWDREHTFNKESVFTLYFTPSNQIEVLGLKEISYYKGQALFDYTSEYGMNTFRFLIINGLTIDPEILLMPERYWGCQRKFYHDYPASYRKDVTFFNKPYFPDLDTLYADTGYVYISEVDPDVRIIFRKFFYEPYYIAYGVTEENGGSEKNMYGDEKLYVFRFAQTLLTYAEASAKAGKLTDLSYECVNKIRRRAHNVNIHVASEFDLLPGLSADAFADSVVFERSLELAGEVESGWFDLLRLGKLDGLALMREQGEGSFMNLSPDYFLPIPADDILLNPNLDITEEGEE